MSRATRTSVALLGLLLLFGAAACSGKKKKADRFLLSAEERYQQGLDAIQQRQLQKATESLSRVDYYSARNRSELEPLVRLALADATFYQGGDIALIDARALYLDFVTLFSDHERAAYAQFQAGICSLSQVRNPSRDQTQTHQAISDFRVIETRWPISEYAVAGAMMRNQAEANLVLHEVMVGNFYLKRKAYLAAAERFRKILDRYPTYGNKEEIYFQLGQALIESNNTAEARIYLDKLVTDYPDGKYVDQARKVLNDVGGRLDLDLNP